MGKITKVAAAGLVSLLAGCWTTRQYHDAPRPEKRPYERREELQKLDEAWERKQFYREVEVAMAHVANGMRNGNEYYRFFTTTPTKAEAFLKYEGNVNAIARALLEYDADTLGECVIGIYGPKEKITVKNIPHNRVYVNAFKDIVENNASSNDIRALLHTVLLNTYGEDRSHPGYVHMYYFLKEGENPSAREYFLDVLEGAVDRIVSNQGIEYSRKSLLALAHTHPSGIPDFSEHDNEVELDSNAFEYFNGKLFYQVFRDNLTGEHVRRMIVADVTDKELMFNLDLHAAKLMALNNIDFYSSPWLAAFGHLMRAMKNTGGSAAKKSAIEETISYLYDRLDNQLTFLKGNRGDSLMVAKRLKRLDELVLENNLIIPGDKKRDASLSRYRSSVIPTRTVAGRRERLAYPMFSSDVISSIETDGKPESDKPGIIEFHPKKDETPEEFAKRVNKDVGKLTRERQNNTPTPYIPPEYLFYLLLAAGGLYALGVGLGTIARMRNNREEN